MVSVATDRIGGLFIIISFPAGEWVGQNRGALPRLLQVPVTATFGLLSVFVCFAIGYDLGKRLKQEAIVSASMATLIFLMIQLTGGETEDIAFSMDNPVQRAVHRNHHRTGVRACAKFFTDHNIVVKLRKTFRIAYEFSCHHPAVFLVVTFWVIRFVLGVDIDHR
jgi:PTS system cellobiose-specific IIC component